MALGEFDLIRRYFSKLTAAHPMVDVGIGDDAALLRVPPEHQLVATVDTLVAGVHFFAEVDPADLGWKALAVNLSDLAAMGAKPVWFTLALTLPSVDEAWLASFASGLGEIASGCGVALVGGDTTQGPLAITIQAHGIVPVGAALRRDGARVGDLIALTGTVGDAALALNQIQSGAEPMPGRYQRLVRPIPRIEIGQALRDIASAAIDVSDGLIADLGHICRSSGVGANINVSSIPLSDEAEHWVRESDQWQVLIGGGDDYELLVTLPADRASELAVIANHTPIQIVGEIVQGSAVTFLKADGTELSPGVSGWDHFGARPNG
jgi:thiamine-monophosphate kinase